MDVDRLWTYEDLERLNVLQQPAWVYSCRQQKLLWANSAALQYFNKHSLEAFISINFSWLPPAERRGFITLNCLLSDEVEASGLELTFGGFGYPVLPGVPPHTASSSSKFLYKPLKLQLQSAPQPTQCTLIQLVTPSGEENCSSCASTFKVPKPLGHVPTSSDRVINGMGPTPSSATLVANLRDLFQDILTGREVAHDLVAMLQSSLLRGDIISTPGRIEEELLSKEALDQDVGLNLLQLLGSHTELVGEDENSLFRGGDSLDGNSLPRDANSESHMALAQQQQQQQQQQHSPSRHGGCCHAMPVGGGSDRMSAGRSTLCARASDMIDGEVVAASLMPAMEAVLATVDHWRFDAFKLAEVTQGHPLSALGFWLMKRHDIISQFELDSTKLARFLRRVEDGYPDNPYHNKTHAAHVLQGMHVLLTRGGLQRRLGEEMSSFAGYLAAILHDYEHRGLNNDFLVRVGDDLALTYNDMAPMENHHVAASFKLLRNKDFNFMRKLRREKWVRLRRLLIDAVLATDMKQHFNVLSKFQAKLQVKLRGSGFPVVSNGSVDGPLSDDAPLVIMEDDADKSLILQVALKIADVGHLAAPWEVHHRWVVGLEEEFFRQGDKEKGMHMMVSPLMDRTKDGITKSQVGFFDIVALPLFYSWCAVFNSCMPLLRAVEDNCNRWRAMEAERQALGGLLDVVRPSS